MIQRDDSNSVIADAFRFDWRLLTASSHNLLLATETNGPRVKGGVLSKYMESCPALRCFAPKRSRGGGKRY